MKLTFENLNESVINWAQQRGITGKENSRNQFIKTVEETVGYIRSGYSRMLKLCTNVSPHCVYTLLPAGAVN